MDRYQRKQEENKMTRMEMIRELENHGILVNRKANTVRVTKKYLAFKDDQRKKKDKKSIGHVGIHKISRQRKHTLQRRKECAIAEIGRHVVPRYRAVKKIGD
jgi:hypothetical protein